MIWRSRRWLLSHCPNDDAELLIVIDGLRWLCPVCGYVREAMPIPQADLRAQIHSGLLPDQRPVSL